MSSLSPSLPAVPCFPFLMWTLQIQWLFKEVFSSKTLWSEGKICIIRLKKAYTSALKNIGENMIWGKESLIFWPRRSLTELSLLTLGEDVEHQKTKKEWACETFFDLCFKSTVVGSLRERGVFCFFCCCIVNLETGVILQRWETQVCLCRFWNKMCWLLSSEDSSCQYHYRLEEVVLRSNLRLSCHSACFDHMMLPNLHRSRASLADIFHTQLLRKEPNTFHSGNITRPVGIRFPPGVAHVCSKPDATLAAGGCASSWWHTVGKDVWRLNVRNLLSRTFQSLKPTLFHRHPCLTQSMLKSRNLPWSMSSFWFHIHLSCCQNQNKTFRPPKPWST